ncbi:DUF6213 family protein [Streptomyces sp. NBC_01142]|uniref:DUF6213 family protein n=1 Tax=Streptomyces sp. NBC_01142 TaxID=2975865 RepID=UPI00225A02C6|nr:DUF6213 family protein [Streptomyces sp. NBC_01142]MCX4825517.1 DUF6213 family protein [Streptomyces sp. NBC_01142]
MSQQVTLPLVPDTDGVLQVPADEVSRLLRRLGKQWLTKVRTGGSDLDGETVATLTIELAKLADRIDVACIAHHSNGDGSKR